MTTAPDIAPTILELVGLEAPPTAQGWHFQRTWSGALREEHRPFVISSWPLYFAEGEFTSAVDAQHAAHFELHAHHCRHPKERSLILGGPAQMPELYDLTEDPQRADQRVGFERRTRARSWRESALSFLERQGTPEEYLKPRRMALEEFASSPSRGRSSRYARWRSRQRRAMSERNSYDYLVLGGGTAGAVDSRPPRRA